MKPFRQGAGETVAFAIATMALLGAALLAALMPSPLADPTRIARIELPFPVVVRPPAPPPQPSRADENRLEDARTAALAEAQRSAPDDGAQLRTALPRVDENGLIPLQFDLETPGAGSERVSDDAVVVRKTFTFGAREIGTAQIHIDGASRLLVDTAELGSLMERSGIEGPEALARGEGGLRTFTDLRRMGVDLRYDPARDRVALTVS